MEITFSPIGMIHTPFLDSQPHGVAQPPQSHRLSLAQLVCREQNQLHVAQIDVLDGTPLLDIKPYIHEFKDAQEFRTGWLERARGQVRTQSSDDRFK